MQYILYSLLYIINLLNDLLKDRIVWIFLFIMGMVLIFVYRFNNLEKVLNGILEQISKQFRKKDIGDDSETIFSILTDVRDKLTEKKFIDEYYNKIKSYKIPVKEMIKQEELRELKSDINKLLELPDNWDNRLALPIEKSAVKKAIRFILLMDSYNYLTKNNRPAIDGTPEGGVSLRFTSTGISWFGIEIPPEDNQPIYYYQLLIDEGADPVVAHHTVEGYFDNPLQVLHELIESGELRDS